MTLTHYDQGQLLIFLPTFVQAALWGIYTTLFCLCIYIFQQREGKRQRVFQAVNIIMFLLCTAQCAFSICLKGLTGLESIPNWLYVITNLIADLLFTYRCYVIWGNDRIIIIVPLVLTFVNTGAGFFIAQRGKNVVGFGTGVFGGDFKIKPNALEDPNVPFDSRTSLFLSLATNMTLTVLSAGHIWWHSREIRKVLGPKASKKHDTAIALIVESGSIYCATVILYLASMSISTNVLGGYDNIGIASQIIFGALTQIVGITPTLIIVRIGLGINPQDVQTVIQAASQLQFAHSRDGTSLGTSLGLVSQHTRQDYAPSISIGRGRSVVTS